MNQASPLRDRRAWILIAGTLAVLALAWASKEPCIHTTWDGHEYALMCYNDAQRLYANRGFDQDVTPYIGEAGANPDGTPRGFFEYPVLTGLFLYLVALLTTGETQFMMVNSALLGAFALGTTVLLLMMVKDHRRLVYWVGAPPLVLYAFHNWDLIAIFFATLAIFAYSRAQWAWSGIACALGASAKIYPGFFLPLIAVAIWKHEGGFRRGSIRFAVGAFGALLLANGPFLLLNPQLWWLTYKVQLGRAPNFESIWNILVLLGNSVGQPWLVEFAEGPLLGIVNLTILIGIIAWLGWRVWNLQLAATPAVFAVILAFLVLNKVYSVQYTLWIIPFFAILQLPARKYAAVVIADTASYLAVFHKLTLNEQDTIAFYPVIALAILARAASFVWLFVGVTRPRHLAPFGQAVPAAEKTG